MQQLVKTLRGSTFLRQNAILFAGSLGVGLLNYLYYPVLGRLLHPGSFGEVQTLASLFAQIAIFLGVLGLITVNIVANYSDAEKRNRVIMELEKLALLISLVLLVIVAVGSGSLQHFFKFASPAPFVILALTVVASVPLTFRNAYLRGRKSFGIVSLVGIVGSAADLVLATAFVLAGWGTAGAIAGLLVGQLIAFGVAAVYARKQGFSESLRHGLKQLPNLKLLAPELKYALLVLVVSLGMTAMYSVDTIVVKHYFDARTAGLYAGIATIARIVYFLTGSVAGVLLPSVKLHHSAKQNQQVLLKSFILLAGVGGLALLGLILLPHFVIRMLMGSTYLTYANLLPRLSLVLFVISLLNLFIMYHMALRRYAVAVIVIIGIAVTYILLRAHHQTLLAVIDSLLYGSLTMMASLGIWLGGAKLNLNFFKS